MFLRPEDKIQEGLIQMNLDHVDKSSFRPIVGIDLGTTNSAVAYIHEGRPQVVSSEGGESLLPSVVLLDPSGQVIVGQDARDGLIAMPDRAIAAVKRLMGSSDAIPLGTQTFLPEEISAFILKELRARLVTLYGDQEIEAVITVPAYFNDAQRRATKQAGELAGFVVERIINEPTAAALAYGLDHSQERQNVLVYDLGGGTFDVSVVTLEHGVIEVKASNGNRHLGGEDFDWRLVDAMADQVQKDYGVDPRQDLRARAILKNLAEHTKWTLSDELKATVQSPLLMVHEDRGVVLQTVIDRTQFETMIQAWLDETLALVKDVLEQSDLDPGSIDDVLLVGGSTRIPRVRQMIAEYFGRPARGDVDPDLVVALGAAVQAGIKAGVFSGSVVATDVAPFSMGIAGARPFRGGWVPGFFESIIRRNTTIPCTQSKIFGTLSDDQDTIEVEIYQGENAMVASNYHLGSFMLNGIPQASAGSETIEVTFRYNLNGILEATARIASTKHAKSIIVQDGLERHSAHALELSRARIEALWQKDTEFLLDQTPLGRDVIDVLAVEEDAEVGEEEFYANLEEDAKTALKDLEILLEEVENKQDHKRLSDLLVILKKAMTTEDREALEQAIDDATDLIFELED